MQIDKYLIIQMQTSLPLRDVGKVWENVHDTWFCLFSSCFIQLMQALAQETIDTDSLTCC